MRSECFEQEEVIRGDWGKRFDVGTVEGLLASLGFYDCAIRSSLTAVMEN